MLHSQIIRSQDFDSEAYRTWSRILGLQGRTRKNWEWAMIAQALDERGALVPGMHGIGFGVGVEPFPLAFVEFGCYVLATDQREDAPNAKEHWGDTGQLGTPEVYPCCPFEHVDMNAVPAQYAGCYDFAWSASSLDHVGSHELAFRFIEASLRCLRPGGVAVHTTEFTFGTETVTEGSTVFFRRSDLERLAERVRAIGCTMEVIDDTRGGRPEDYAVDRHPYTNPNHLVLESAGCDVTSILLIFTRYETHEH